MAVLTALSIVLLPSTVATARAKPPALALSDDLAFVDSRPGPRALAFKTAREAGARFVRVTLDWSRVAPKGKVKPSGFDAEDPYDLHYQWGYIEDAVRDATRAGLRVVLVVVRAPAWAEGSSRAADAPAGSWRPDPEEFGDFMRAAVRRFSGFFPDFTSPGDGITGRGYALPEVRYWQIWSEPNGGKTLQPVGGAVEHYRRLLNAAAPAFHRQGDRSVVIAGGTAPGGAIPALTFWRKLACLDRAERRVSCSERPRFDIAAHDPVTQRPPQSDGPTGVLGFTRLGALKRLLARAVDVRSVRPARAKPLWLTGVGWDTPPLRPRGVSPSQQARFLAEALFLADQAGAALFDWSGLQDRTTYLRGFPSVESGLFFNSENDVARDEPKPAFEAFRFPFLVDASGDRASAWGMAPRKRGAVVIERKSKRGWREVRAVQRPRSRVFRIGVPASHGVYRARQGQAISLPWRF